MLITPRDIVKTTEEEISKILYANGHSVYHPVLVEQLTKFVEDKINQLKDEQEALEVANKNYYQTARKNIERQLAEAAINNDHEGVTIYSQALQRI